MSEWLEQGAEGQTTTYSPASMAPRSCLGCCGWTAIGTLALIGCLVIVSVGLPLLGVGKILGFIGDLFNFDTTPVIHPTDTVLTLVQREAVLVTARYNFEKVIPVEFAQHLGGISGEKLLYIGVGYVNAGVDLGNVDEGAIANDGINLTITLPPAHLTDCVLDVQKSYVYDRDVGIINFLYDAFYDEPDLRTIAESEAIRAFRESAIEEGILQMARTEAEKQLRSILLAAGVDSVIFKTDETVSPQHDVSCTVDASEEVDMSGE